MNIKFCVITGDCEDRLANVEHHFFDPEKEGGISDELGDVMCPVFCLGEIIPCEVDEKKGYARELGGALRGLHKWGVQYEAFDKIEDAIKRSKRTENI